MSNYIRLSEAILIGDSLKRRSSYGWLDDSLSYGCAIGGALVALGCGREYISNRSNYNYNAANVLKKHYYPWLTTTTSDSMAA